jgi:hypothetical protein
MSVTSTSWKRGFFQKRYLKKDSRTAIYLALCGPTQYGTKKRYNDPLSDPTRSLVAPNWERIKDTIKENWRDAAFDPLTARRVISYFNSIASEVTINMEELA